MDVITKTCESVSLRCLRFFYKYKKGRVEGQRAAWLRSKEQPVFRIRRKSLQKTTSNKARKAVFPDLLLRTALK